jgi:hypothetical protein
VLVAQGDAAGAMKAYCDGLAIRQRLAAAAPTNAGWQRDLSVSHHKVGEVLVARGDAAGAQQAYRDSLTIRQRLAAAEPTNAQWKREPAVSHCELGRFCMRNGETAEGPARYMTPFAFIVSNVSRNT